MLKTLLFLTALAVSHGSEIRLTEPHSECPNSGEWYLPHEFDCTKFYYCQNGEKFIIPRDCPSGTEFSTTLLVCVHPSLAACGLQGEAVTTAPVETTTEDSCEYLDNGCPADFNIHLLLPHETSCRKFYYCANGELVLSSCGRGSVFNPATQTCGQPGSIDRVCIEEDSSEEDPIVEDSGSSEEIERLPNGCPVDYSISTYLPHDYYCNKYYQCEFGQLVERRCAPGTHFNPEIQGCDTIAVVGCTLAGGDAAASEEVEDTPEDVNVITPPSNLLPNGCPVDGSINWLVPHEDCSKYYHCVWGSLVEGSCPENLHFSVALQRCESPLIAGCKCKNKECDGESGDDSSVGGNDNESSSEEDRPAGDAPSNPESGENQPGDEDAVIVPPSDLLDNGCPVDGNINWLVPSEDCSKFYYCVWGHLVEASCPAGLHFSIEYQRCETPEIAGCGSGEITPPGGNDNDSNDEEDTPAGGEGNDSSNEQNDDDAAPTPPSDLLENGCPVDGTIHWLVPSEDCSKFYYCVWGNLVEASCPAGLHFSFEYQRCETPEVAGCGSGEITPPGGNDNDSNNEEDTPAGGDGNDSSGGENQPGGDDNNASSDEQNNENAVIIPPSDILDNGCPVDGNIDWLVPSEDCSKFYYCVWGSLVEASCPADLHFSFELQRCETPEIAGCASGEIAPPGGDDNDSSSEEDRPAGDAPSNPDNDENNASSDEQNEDDAIVPPSDLLDNGCPVDGTIHWLVPSEDCSKFYYCVWGNLVEASCPAGLHFSFELQRCELPEVAGCGSGEIAPPGDNDNDSNSEGDSSAGDAPGSNSGETVVGSNEQDEDDTAIIPPSDILDNGCPVDDTIHWLVPGEDCSTFYYCVWGNLVEASCPPGLQFSFELQRCDFPEIVGCGSGEDTPVGGNDSESSSEEDRPAGDAPSNPDSGEDTPVGGNGSESSSEEDRPAGDAPSNPDSGENQPGGDDNNTSSDEQNDDDVAIIPPSDLLDNGCPVDGNIHWLVPGEDCSDFYYCVWGELIEASCPPGLHFSFEYQRCEYPEIAGCVPGVNDNDSGNDDDASGSGEGNDSSSEGNLPGGNDSSEEDLPIDDDGNDNDASDESTGQGNRCEEECNVLPWAHVDCDKYWACDGKQAVLVICSEGLHFNPSTHTCDFICNAGCVRTKIQTTPSDEGVRIFFPWDQLDSKSEELLKLIAQ